jgi:hypothetical protein
MKGKRYSTEDKIRILRQADAGGMPEKKEEINQCRNSNNQNGTPMHEISPRID